MRSRYQERSSEQEEAETWESSVNKKPIDKYGGYPRVPSRARETSAHFE
jgi:hypothetical protein